MLRIKKGFPSALNLKRRPKRGLGLGNFNEKVTMKDFYMVLTIFLNSKGSWVYFLESHLVIFHNHDSESKTSFWLISHTCMGTWFLILIRNSWIFLSFCLPSKVTEWHKIESIRPVYQKTTTMLVMYFISYHTLYFGKAHGSFVFSPFLCLRNSSLSFRKE